MAAGRISADRADVIAAWTASLSDADAARADEILAAAAPGLRWDQLYRKAAALELRLNPEGAKARKEHMKASRRRVEVRREDSGNARLAGRELDTVDVLGCKAYIDAPRSRRPAGPGRGGLRERGIPGPRRPRTGRPFAHDDKHARRFLVLRRVITWPARAFTPTPAHAPTPTPAHAPKKMLLIGLPAGTPREALTEAANQGV